MKMEFLQLNEITIEILKDAEKMLEGYDSRIFKAKVVRALGPGGQRKAERELEWNRKTIRKGLYELENDVCINRLSETGRKSSEYHLPNLLGDIAAIVKPSSQADPTFRTTQLYSPLTAGEVRRRLIEDMGYNDEELPCERTIRTKLNDMEYKPQKVGKTRPVKKIPQTDAIFDRVRSINKEADETEGVIRASLDAKAAINIGPFSRGGYNRSGVQASDHDFAPETVLKLFGVFLPAHDESFLYFTESSVTPDFMFDVLEDLWPEIDRRFNPHTLVINSDNGPENNSHRTQFVRRAVEFAFEKGITVRLAYYPPYHSKYNPIERIWGVLENHWNGELLNSIEKVMGLARTMKWNGKNPAVKMVKGIYETGAKLTKKVMAGYEALINRLPGLEKWFVDIIPDAV
jgi:transposase